MKKKINLTFSHFEQIHKNGYNLDLVYMLELISSDESADIKIMCCDVPKMEALCQTLFRKGLVTEEYKITTIGKDLLTFLASDKEEKLVKKKATDDDFDRWWKAYPGTDTFTYKEKLFQGTRSLRVKKDDCKIKLRKIIAEGEYTLDELIAALEYEVKQKKENSVKSRDNKLSFMQNSLTYLNQRTFEPFIELIKEGATIKETPEQNFGSTDI
jgi:hypothetical protein